MKKRREARSRPGTTHCNVTSDTHKLPVVERGVMVVEAGLVDAISTGDHGQSERRPSRSPSASDRSTEPLKARCQSSAEPVIFARLDLPRRSFGSLQGPSSSSVLERPLP